MLFSTRKSSGSLEDFTNRGIASGCADLTRFKLATLRSIVRLIDEHRIEAVLAELVQGHVDDPDLRQRMGRAALSHARQAFSPERGTANILAWYQQTLGLGRVIDAPRETIVEKAAG